MNEQTKRKWYQKNGWIIALLILFWPVGLFLMWKFASWSKLVKWIITVFVAISFIFYSIAIADAAPSITVEGATFSNDIRTDKEDYLLRGRVTGSDTSVTVNGKDIQTDSSGKFSTTLELKNGDNQVKIIAREDDKTTEEVFIITRGEINTSSAASSAKSDEDKTSFKVGDTATIDDRSLTVSMVTRNFQGNEYSGPDSGKEFVVYEVTLNNNSDSEVSYNTYDFKVQDSNGAQDTEAFIVGIENSLSSGSLAPGGKVTGNLGYEVPAGDKGLKLIFKPSFWSSKTVTFSL